MYNLTGAYSHHSMSTNWW